MEIEVHRMTRKELLDILQTEKTYLAAQFGLVSIGLFGSYAKGSEGPDSDIDLLVTFKPEARFGLVTYCELENLLSEKLGKKVDLVMKKGLKPHIGKYILNEVVYL